MSTSSGSSDPFFTGEPAPSSGSNNNNNSDATSSSSLYLFTFLATLLLLLVVSCGIVFRSLLIRRRYRRRVEQAIEQGLIPPSPNYGAGFTFEGVLGRRQRDFGTKPKLWDSWIEGPITAGDAKWSEIKPVSVKVIAEPETCNTRDIDTSTAAFSDSQPEPHPPRRFLAAINPFSSSHRRSRSPSPSTVVSPAPLLSPKPETGEKEGENNNNSLEEPTATLEVAILIAMPSPFRRPHTWASTTSATHEEDLPDVVFGVTEVPLNLNVREDCLHATNINDDDEREAP